MDTPSLVTQEERRTIAKEIASKYLSFASSVHVTFSKRGILIEIFPDKDLKIPPGQHVMIVEKEDF
jgi:hypothetical protein